MRNTYIIRTKLKNQVYHYGGLRYYFGTRRAVPGSVFFCLSLGWIAGNVSQQYIVLEQR